MTENLRTDTRPNALTVDDPRTGESVGTVPIATAEEIEGALALAHWTATDWSTVPAAERGSLVHAMADALEAAREELAELNTRETGKLPEDARGGIDAAVGTLRQYAELGPVHRGRSLRGEVLAADYTLVRPRGVVLALTPWNDPVAVAAGLLGAAIVTGNTVVHKPSERCPHLGRYLGEVLASVLPEGVLTTVTGDGAVGERFVADPRVDVVAHVGSTATGREIAAAAAITGAHVVLENGGNDALVIDAGVDPAWAADQAALGAFANAGQICTSVERILVHESLAGEFLDALVARAQEWNSPQPRQPLVDLAHREGVHAQVSEALSRGARALTGGTVPEGPGAFYPATVLVDCPEDSPVVRDETFGPVAPVLPVPDFAEGLRRAAADRYGLAATVLTPRIDRALAATSVLPVGTIKVNGVFGGAPGGSAQPQKASGTGFGYGPELLDEMTTVSVVHIESPTVPTGAPVVPARAAGGVLP